MENRAENNGNNNVPIAIPPPNTLNAIRSTYMNLFNQILDSSFNINCICKTTFKINSKQTNQIPSTLPAVNKCNIFDKVHGDFMSDEDDNEELGDDAGENDDECLSDKNENDIEMQDNPLNELSRDRILFDLDYMDQQTDGLMFNKKMNKICDLSCFEHLRYVHSTFKNCFNPLPLHSNTSNTNVNDNKNRSNGEKFEAIWTNLKFLSKNPKSCDYYGSTLFHYAASDNQCELLKSLIDKDPSGVFCIDSKGMTPLMRAVQRNSINCVEFLLSETKSDLNGSSYSAYTPLWFAVSNGYTDLVKLILNYNASASIVDKTLKKSNFNLNSNDVNLLIQDEDHIGIRRDVRTSLNSISDQTRSNHPQHTSYLFSPLRASIVYSRFQIMITLLEYDANVYELFGATFNNEESNKPTYNDDYVNALKLLHRQFGPFLSQNLNEYDKCLNKLNEFISCPNVYRRMLIEFVKNVYSKIESNQVLASQLSLNLNASNKNSLDQIRILTENFERYLSEQNGKGIRGEDDWRDYLNLASDFFVSIDFLLSSNNEQNNNNPILNENNVALNQLSRKPLFHQTLFEFSKFLMEKFFAPKKLKELCRFKLRKIILSKIQRDQVKYSKTFTKRDHQVAMLKTFNLPNNLIDYLMHSN